MRGLELDDRAPLERQGANSGKDIGYLHINFPPSLSLSLCENIYIRFPQIPERGVSPSHAHSHRCIKFRHQETIDVTSDRQPCTPGKKRLERDKVTIYLQITWVERSILSH